MISVTSRLFLSFKHLICREVWITLNLGWASRVSSHFSLSGLKDVEKGEYFPFHTSYEAIASGDLFSMLLENQFSSMVVFYSLKWNGCLFLCLWEVEPMGCCVCHRLGFYSLWLRLPRMWLLRRMPASLNTEELVKYLVAGNHKIDNLGRKMR